MTEPTDTGDDTEQTDDQQADEPVYRDDGDAGDTEAAGDVGDDA